MVHSVPAGARVEGEIVRMRLHRHVRLLRPRERGHLEEGLVERERSAAALTPRTERGKPEGLLRWSGWAVEELNRRIVRERPAYAVAGAGDADSWC